MAKRVEDGLEAMHPAVASWFRETLGAPTLPQRLGWPQIAAGRHTLILAPTGSGKTLAAFLACLDQLWRDPIRGAGVRILYVSPLKALNYDISRNLEAPLEGIIDVSKRLMTPLRPLTVGVRTGDTSQADRQRMVRRPPEVLITTPESLHLLLTSKARSTLKTISHVIVDEIHALCGNKRGTFLAVLLERLEAIVDQPFTRIGLSATQRPLEEVARYLGGQTPIAFEPRPVTIIDAGQRKDLDLETAIPANGFSGRGDGSVWPGVEHRLLDWIGESRSTIIFANNRRVVERLTARLNQAMDADPDEPIVRAHHGSLSLEERRVAENALKEGRLRAVVSTASLEMGIDMGSVDLVCQVESPGAVSRSLQRVGRAGHAVGQASRGKLIAKTPGDLLEAAALTRAMLDGAVELSRVPRNCLDILAQQIVACVAVESWGVMDLFHLFRQTYSYRDLTPDAFESALSLVSGRFATESVRDLQPRISWDRIHQRLRPLPGSVRLAIAGGGAIPDTGQYPVYLGDGGPRLGELDEEFVLERRVGETFILGTSAWRIDAIEPHRVLVSKAEGESVLAPFWRGESCPRSAELGEAIGRLTRMVADRRNDPELLSVLKTDYGLGPAAAKALRDYVSRQVAHSGAAPDDQTIVLETFRDPTGEFGLAVLTPFGGKLHYGLKLAILGDLKRRTGVEFAAFHSDDGLLIRLPNADHPPWRILDDLTPDRAEELIRAELGESALFGLRYRQNAGRALLLPKPDPGKRTPLWLQRLRAKDLLQITRQYPDFPIVVESYRQCLDEDLDLPRLRTFLERLREGSIRVRRHQGESPSPFASSLVFRFQAQYLYEWDEPKTNSRSGGASERAPLHEITAALLDQVALNRVNERLRNVGRPPRTLDEMAERLRLGGDLLLSELTGPMEAFLRDLSREGRASLIELGGQPRWISAEEAEDYARAFDPNQPEESSRLKIVRRFLRNRALAGLDDLQSRYPLAPTDALDLLERLVLEGAAVRGDPHRDWFADPDNLADARRLTIAIRRKEAVAIAPEAFADFVARRQFLHPETRTSGSEGLETVLDRLQGFAVPLSIWESDLLPRRVRDFRPAMLDDLLAQGDWVWRVEPGADDSKSEPSAAFLVREFATAWPDPPTGNETDSEEAPVRMVQRILDERGAQFVADLAIAAKTQPSAVRKTLAILMRRGVAANDRMAPLRSGWETASSALALSPSARRRGSAPPEGRWQTVRSNSGTQEDRFSAWTSILKDRYGVLCRETADLEPNGPSWSELAPHLDRLEWKGELRRGYFVEGLSGRQYCDSETAEALAEARSELAASSRDLILLCAQDPANLYGSGAPFDIPLLEGGTARLHRNPSAFLAMESGRPILIAENYGRRLTWLDSASESQRRAAALLLPSLASGARRILKVETCNGAPAARSPCAAWLTEAGFVRDYPGMAYYGVA